MDQSGNHSHREYSFWLLRDGFKELFRFLVEGNVRTFLHMVLAAFLWRSLDQTADSLVYPSQKISSLPLVQNVDDPIR